MNDSICWTWTKYATERLEPLDPGDPTVTDRQERIPGFDQARFSSLCVALIGAGGLNGETGEGLVRKGIGCLKIYDPDRVELSNLSRQRFFAKDLGENKAFALVRNLVPEATGRTFLAGCRLAFEEAVRTRDDILCDVAVCGVDNNRTRIFASTHFAAARVPLVLLGVSADGGHGYVFVQETGGACFGCAFPDVIATVRDPCPNTPAIKDILKAVAANALYAVDSLFMARKRLWNYKHVFLDGSLPERSLVVPKRPDCVLCRERSQR